jgi:hypothetical protein
MTLVDQPGADRLAGKLAAAGSVVGRRRQLQLPDRVRFELALDPKSSRPV